MGDWALIDTCVYLFAAYEPNKLSRVARDLLDDPAVGLLWSPASTWELVIKERTGKLSTLPGVVLGLSAGLRRIGVHHLPIRHDHTLRVARLPEVHKDPFDRILIAQALEEHVEIVTSDQIIPRYPGVRVAW